MIFRIVLNKLYTIPIKFTMEKQAEYNAYCTQIISSIKTAYSTLNSRLYFAGLSLNDFHNVSSIEKNQSTRHEIPFGVSEE